VSAGDGSGAFDRPVGLEVCGFEELREGVARYFRYPVRIDPLGPICEFRSSYRFALLGPITVGSTSYNQDIRFHSGDLETAYYVNIPLTGPIVQTHRGATLLGQRGHGVVLRPDGRIGFDPMPARRRVLSVKIERSALEHRLAAALGRSITGPVPLAPLIDVSRGSGRSWVRLAASLLQDDVIDTGAFAGNPLVTDHLVDSLIAGLLVVADHPYREELTRPERSWRPRPLRLAMDAMRADLAHQFTVEELARLADVSVRSLQAIFRRHTGQPPMAYLRELRLGHAHEELCRAGPGATTVARVANAWGFGHLGRFAAAYRERYGVAPSVTLRT
jgi:AraC-like DNA-binding protein